MHSLHYSKISLMHPQKHIFFEDLMSTFIQKYFFLKTGLGIGIGRIGKY